MTDLRRAAYDYLAVRRNFGLQLVQAERLLGQFVDHLEVAGA